MGSDPRNPHSLDPNLLDGQVDHVRQLDHLVNAGYDLLAVKGIVHFILKSEEAQDCITFRE